MRKTVMIIFRLIVSPVFFVITLFIAFIKAVAVTFDFIEYGGYIEAGTKKDA